MRGRQAHDAMSGQAPHSLLEPEPPPAHGPLPPAPPSFAPQSITTPQPHPANPSWWVGVGGGASADPAITEGSTVEGEGDDDGRGHAFGVGMSDPGRKTRRGGGSSSRGKELGAWAGGAGSRAGYPATRLVRGRARGLARATCGRKTSAGRAGCREEGGRFL